MTHFRDALISALAGLFVISAFLLWGVALPAVLVLRLAGVI